MTEISGAPKVLTILNVNYIRDCRKSPNCTFLLFPHLVKSTTYKSRLVAKLRVLGFFDSLYEGERKVDERIFLQANVYIRLHFRRLVEHIKFSKSHGNI